MKLDLRHGDCVQRMQELEADSIDVLVCDPPYGLRFMGKEFDDLGDGALQREWHVQWLRQAFRVLKPGGLIKAFGGTRTFHHMAAAMEDVGLLLDPESCLEAWIYSTGFPKSLNISKALVKQAEGMSEDAVQAASTTEAAQRWEGWGTALKPAWEPVIVGCKPSVESSNKTGDSAS